MQCAHCFLATPNVPEYIFDNNRKQTNKLEPRIGTLAVAVATLWRSATPCFSLPIHLPTVDVCEMRSKTRNKWPNKPFSCFNCCVCAVNCFATCSSDWLLRLYASMSALTAESRANFSCQSKRLFQQQFWRQTSAEHTPFALQACPTTLWLRPAQIVRWQSTRLSRPVALQGRQSTQAAVKPATNIGPQCQTRYFALQHLRLLAFLLLLLLFGIQLCFGGHLLLEFRQTLKRVVAFGTQRSQHQRCIKQCASR